MHVHSVVRYEITEATVASRPAIAGTLDIPASSHPVGEQPRHPARGQRRREGDTQRRASAFRGEHTLLNQGGDDTPRLPIAGADDRGSVAAWELAAIEQGFKHGASFRRQLVGADLLVRP